MSYKLVKKQSGGIPIDLSEIINNKNNVFITGGHGLTDLNSLYVVPKGTYIITLVNVGKTLTDGILTNIYLSKDYNDIIEKLNEYNNNKINIYGPDEIMFMPKLNFNYNYNPGLKFDTNPDKEFNLNKKKTTLIKLSEKENNKYQNRVNIFENIYYSNNTQDFIDTFIKNKDEIDNICKSNKTIDKIIDLFKENDFLFELDKNEEKNHYYGMFQTTITISKIGIYQLPIAKTFLHSVDTLIEKNSLESLLDSRNNSLNDNLLEFLKSHDVILEDLEKLFNSLNKYNPYTVSFHVCRYLFNYKEFDMKELIEKFDVSNKSNVFILGNCRNFINFIEEKKKDKRPELARQLSKNARFNNKLNKSFLLFLILFYIYYIDLDENQLEKSIHNYFVLKECNCLDYKFLNDIIKEININELEEYNIDEKYYDDFDNNIIKVIFKLEGKLSKNLNNIHFEDDIDLFYPIIEVKIKYEEQTEDGEIENNWLFHPVFINSINLLKNIILNN